MINPPPDARERTRYQSVIFNWPDCYFSGRRGAISLAAIFSKPFSTATEIEMRNLWIATDRRLMKNDIPMSPRGPYEPSKIRVVQFCRLKKIGKVQIFDMPLKHCILIPDFTIIKDLLQ